MNIQSSNTYSSARFQNFKGLTSKLSNKVYSLNELEELATKYNKSDGVVGSLPADWIKNIGTKDKKEHIKNFYKGFKELIERAKTDGFEHAQARIDALLKRNKLVKKKAKVEIDYIGQGSFGDAFRIFDGKKSYALKIFKNKTEPLYPIHGNFVEQNFISYINKNSTKNSPDWVKMHFGDVKAGYMVSDYVSSQDKLPNNRIKLYNIGLHYTDNHPSNIRRGAHIDPGGMKYFLLAKNKSARYIFKCADKLKYSLNKENFLEKTINNKSVPQYEDKMIGVFSALVSGNIQTKKNLFKTLIDNCGQSLDKTLSHEFQAVPSEHKSEIVNRIIKNKDIENIRTLSENCFKNSNADARDEYFNKLFKINDNDVKKNLAFNLNKNHDEHFDLKYKKLFKLNDKNIDMLLAKKITQFDNDYDIYKWVKRFKKRNDKDVLEILKKEAEYLSPIREEFVANILNSDLHLKDLRYLIKKIIENDDNNKFRIFP